MENYRVRLQDLLFKDTGTRDVLNLPLEKFQSKSKINFDKSRGSVRIMNKKVKTEAEADAFIEHVLRTELP